MSISLPTTAIAPLPAIAPATDTSGSALLDLAHNVMAADQIQDKLNKAMKGLEQPDAASLLNTQLLTSQLSVMTAVTSSAVHSLSETAKNAIHNGF
jgi:hypothetical protein